MIHLNEASRRLSRGEVDNREVRELLNSYKLGRIFLYLSQSFMPEIYGAKTIADFLENRGNIIPTTRILPELLFDVYGLAGVQFPIATYKSIENGKGLLEDSTGTLEVMLNSNRRMNLRDTRKKLLRDGTKLYKPHILYEPKTENAWLVSYKISPTAKR